MITQTQSQNIMENWKRQLIMDPTLNIILDTSQPAEVLVTDLIAKKQPQEISTIYSKLGTFKHSLSKHLKKQVQLLAPLIIQNYHQTRQLRFNLQQISPKKAQLVQVKDLLHLYNYKYEQIQSKTQQLKNCAKMLNFAKTYQKYIVQLKILKSLTKGNEITNHLKVSELIHDITEACSTFNFSGLTAFENERVQIGFLKQRLIKENDKMLKQAISKKQNGDIISSIKVSYNLNILSSTLRQYFNGNLLKVINQTKKLFDSDQKIATKLQLYGNTLLKYLLDVLDLQKLMKDNGFTQFFQQYLIYKNLFGQFWKKIVETLQKLSVKFFNQVKNNVQKQQRGIQIKINYPLIFQKVVDVINQINLYVIQFPQNRLGYNFVQLRQQLIRGLTPLATQYHQYIKETSGYLLLQINKIQNSQQSDSIIKSIHSKVQDLINKSQVSELFLQIIQKCCIPIIKRMKQTLQTFKDSSQKDTYNLKIKNLIDLFKTTILESKIGYSLDLGHLQQFQITKTTI